MIEGKYRHQFHIQPPQGWLNDPNGSCFYNGKYHIFFQYSPNSPLGSGGRFWGHYVSDDLAHFTYVDTPILADTDRDRDGAYSGTAYTGDGVLEIYYTGNVKHPGDYDYINEGREHNVIRVDFSDGIHPGDKQLLLTNDDYPSDLSCHVRDPKVWRGADRYYMLLGARSRESKGGLLLMDSMDRIHWSTLREYFPKGDFGYMLECPDYFEADGVHAVAFCPQGMEHEEDRFQNTYESGYSIIGRDILAEAWDTRLDELISKDTFHEWDMGFDFYAPQTFTTPDGRQILIGWAGVPDAGYGNDPAIAEGWQHSLTIPREIRYENGRFYTVPVRELASRHVEKIVDFNQNDHEEEAVFLGNGSEYTIKGGAWDIEMTMNEKVPAGLLFGLNDDLALTDKKGVLSLSFWNDTGCGRKVRRSRLIDGKVRNIRLIFDRSLLEVYVNDGEVVFTTRYYPHDPDRIILRTDRAFSAEGWLIR